MNKPKTWQRACRVFVSLILMFCAIAVPATADNPAQDKETGTQALQTASGPTGIEPHAEGILRAMSEYLKGSPEFTLRAEITYDSVLRTGQKIEYGGVARGAVRRPDRLHVEYRGDQRKTQAVYDGRAFTALDLAANVFTVIEAPGGIDAALEQLFDKTGLAVPIEDLLYSDPYYVLTEQVESGLWVGRHAVDGKPCHHLAFSQENIDWQIWIDDGPRPVPRKLLVTYKNELGSPQYSARFTHWDFDPRISDSYFRFVPPAGSDEVEVLKLTSDEPESEPEKGTEQ